MRTDISQRFEFLKEIDKLRGVNRHNVLIDGSRVENSAEHSWHLALYALILQEHAPAGVDILRVIQMLMIHDIVEIDVGDHPIHLSTDWQDVAAAEGAAADRIFGLLPVEQRDTLIALWREFEADTSKDAQFAKTLDRLQPLFQTLLGHAPDYHRDICRENIYSGRALSVKERFAEMYDYLTVLLEQPDVQAKNATLAAQIGFLKEADQLKSVLRASRLGDGSRRENSAEHSWHILLFALILEPHAHTQVDMLEVLTMLLLHDLVEIDAGDAPIHGVVSAEALAALADAETAAADRIFGLLPTAQGMALKQIWQRFEAAETNEARFAKSIDRVQPVILNLLNGGGSWPEYNVTLDQIDSRVGQKVIRGAPELWDFVQPQVAAWFARQVNNG